MITLLDLPLSFIASSAQLMVSYFMKPLTTANPISVWLNAAHVVNQSVATSGAACYSNFLHFLRYRQGAISCALLLVLHSTTPPRLRVYSDTDRGEDVTELGEINFKS